MITSEGSPFDRVYITIDGTTFQGPLRDIDIRRGGNYGPYAAGPDVGTATVTLHYHPGTTVPTSSFVVNKPIVANIIYTLPNLAYPIFTGTINDVIYTTVYDESYNGYGTTVTIYAVDAVADLEAISVPGIVTPVGTKNQTMEQRWNTLAAYAPTFIPTTSGDNFDYRLVDNNIDASLREQIDLACSSINASWFINTSNQAVFFQGVAGLTGKLLTDEPGYWVPGNYPANAGTITAPNLQFNDISLSLDSSNLVNELVISNVMPKNMVTNFTTGARLYKDPTATPGPALDVIETSYTVSDPTSQTTYGRRSREVQTNLYPYRASDGDGYYLRFNGFADSDFEYEQAPELYISGNIANTSISTSNPQTGTYCVDVKLTSLASAFTIVLGPSSGFPLKRNPVANVNCFQFAIRSISANLRYTRGIQYLDNNGNILSTQLGTLIAPTANTWTTNTTSFMSYTTIPAGTVAWRPICNISHATPGTNFSVGTIFKFDNIAVNTQMQPVALFTGDTADTTTTLSSWLDSPGQSWSVQHRNIQNDIGTDMLTKWKNSYLAPTFVQWNAIQNYKSFTFLEPTSRVDIRFNGTSYTAWVNKISIKIDTENAYIGLDLGTRPSSWI